MGKNAGNPGPPVRRRERPAPPPAPPSRMGLRYEAEKFWDQAGESRKDRRPGSRGAREARPECRACHTAGVKNGTNRHGNRCWRCPACGRQWSEGPGPRQVPTEVARIADRMIGKGMEAGLVAELCGVSRSWVYRRRDRLGGRGA